MGIEVKDHITTTYTSSSYDRHSHEEHKSCDLIFYETHNPLEAVNRIFETIETDENKYEHKESKMFK